MIPSVTLLAALTCVSALPGAADPDWQAILTRLERLEQENVQLKEEVRKLKARLDGDAASIEERVAVNERRLEEQQQTKVESSERVPVKLTCMLLFNAFSGARNGVPADFPAFASSRRGQRQIRGTLEQTSIGLQVESPVTIAGGRAHGEIVMDFFADFDQYRAPRLRTGFLELDWKTRGLRVGVEKPIIAPRNPNSLAQVVYPALWGIGNLWFWEPQIRVEQRFTAADSEVKAQFGIFQTREVAAPGNLPSRPGWQTRWQYSRRFDQDRRIEIAPGFHYSRTLLPGTSLPSQLVTADWLVAGSRWWEVSGAFFHGRNAAPVGGLRQGVVVLADGTPRAVGTTGGWAQLLLRPAERVRIHTMFGEQDDHNRDLLRGNIARNLSWAINSMFQLSPNVVLGLELQQIRTSYIGSSTQVLNRYDVALGYLF